MKYFINKMVNNRRARLRMCAIIALFAVAGCMLWLDIDSPNVMPAEGGEVKRPLEGFKVTLDPGHGGYDGGARARDSGRWEKEVTLEIALAVENALIERGAEVTLTRREDICLCEGDTASKQRKRKDLQARMDTAAAADADVLLSIHLNEYRSRSQSGPQVFYQRGGDEGRLLAGVLQKALIDGLRPKKERVAMAGDYYVLRSSIPSVLVECGFLSNAEEERLLLQGDYQRRIAESLAEGLCEYRELVEKTK